MKPGSLVWYVNAKGEHVEAEVTEIVGQGASGYKLVNLTIDGRKRQAVWHVRDYAGGAHWIEYHDGEHAAAELAESKSVPSPVVPVASAAGRATAGAGGDRSK